MKPLLIFSIFIFLFSCGSDNNSPDPIVLNEPSKDTLVSVSSPKTENIKPLEEIDKEYIPKYKVEFQHTISAYIDDPGSEPTNVRTEPKGDITLQLSKDCDHQVVLKGVADGWFLVGNVWGVDNEDETFEDIDGYIHGSILAVDTRNYGNEELYLYAEPDENSEHVATIKTETKLTLRSATEDANWVKVRWLNNGKSVEGWIQSDWLCGSIVTLCS